MKAMYYNIQCGLLNYKNSIHPVRFDLYVLSTGDKKLYE